MQRPGGRAVGPLPARRGGRRAGAPAWPGMASGSGPVLFLRWVAIHVPPRGEIPPLFTTRTLNLPRSFQENNLRKKRMRSKNT